jgi:hypothetical protein
MPHFSNLAANALLEIKSRLSVQHFEDLRIRIACIGYLRLIQLLPKSLGISPRRCVRGADTAPDVLSILR